MEVVREVVLFWIAAALVFAVAEVATVALFAAFAALGALGAAVAAYAGLDLVWQGVVFALVAAAGILAVRPPLMRYLTARHGPAVLSGASGMVGMTAQVVDPIAGPHGRGHVRIAGENWTALSADGSPVAAGSTVRIVNIDKATLVVAEEKRSKS